MAKLHNAVTQRKKRLIERLLALGVYKKDDHFLNELTLSEIEKEYELELQTQSRLDNQRPPIHKEVFLK